MWRWKGETRLKTLVIVDDEQYVIEDLTQKILNFKEEKVRIVGVARNGVEGLALIRELKPDIIVCDVKMPVMNGLTMVGQLRESGDHTKVSLFPAWMILIRSKQPLASRHRIFAQAVDPQEFEETINTLVEQISRKKLMQKQVEASMPILTQSFIQRLLTKSYKTRREILSAIEFLNCRCAMGTLWC